MAVPVLLAWLSLKSDLRRRIVSAASGGAFAARKEARDRWGALIFTRTAGARQALQCSRQL